MNDLRFEHHRPLSLITDEAQTEPTVRYIINQNDFYRMENSARITIAERGIIVECFYWNLSQQEYTKPSE